jgi:uncharacterized cupredoxin-like copper-binding protein
VIVTALALLTLAAPARVQIGADEFRYSLSRQSIKAGPAIVQLVNYGEDEHDLMIRRVGGTKSWRVAKILPGKRATLSIRLRPGTYRLWCEVGDHRVQGMRATLRVKR